MLRPKLFYPISLEHCSSGWVKLILWLGITVFLDLLTRIMRRVMSKIIFILCLQTEELFCNYICENEGAENFENPFHDSLLLAE